MLANDWAAKAALLKNMNLHGLADVIVGRIVVINGTSRSELNGIRGLCVHSDASAVRVVVFVEIAQKGLQQMFRFKPEHVRVCERNGEETTAVKEAWRKYRQQKADMAARTVKQILLYSLNFLCSYHL
jgi:hypothetical protein